jgi:anti-anti-sigma factor
MPGRRRTVAPPVPWPSRDGAVTRSGPGRRNDALVQDLLPDLDVEVRLEGDHVVVALDGDLLGPTVSRARVAVDAVLDERHDLVLDLSAVRSIDSIGLGLLVRARWRAVDSGVRASFRGVQPALREALVSSRIGELLDLEG